MKTHCVPSIVLSAMVMLAPASAVIAQSVVAQSTAALLTEAEVRQLIVRGAPADHARLSAHFTALADRYAADSKRHDAMGQAFVGNTKLAHMAASQQAHCRQMGARDLEASATLRELAAHHTKQAAGAASEPPKGSQRFEAGTGAAAVPTDAELTRLAATADTAADHRALESYFTTLATRYEKDAKESAAFAASWRGMTRDPSAPNVAARWDRVARQQRDAAAEARAAATMHKDHATKAK